MKKIFCADDDPGLQDVFPIIFARAGYEVTMFTDGEKLLEADQPPDIFLLDKNLSGLNGMDVCGILKTQSSTKNIPVIIVSASADLAKEATKAGADGYLEKPFKLQSLIELMEHHLK